MEKLKLLTTLICLTSSTLALSCGDYLIKAQVIMKDGVSSLVVNPGTKSEINLKVEFKESSKLSPYIGKLIETTARMDKEMDETLGFLATLGPIKILVPNPLANAKGTSMNIIKKTECIKN
ncbi:MAG: hypothetical protein WC635_09620 [Bacteriovorax sp.]|jgi:hypothetical protein